MAETRQGIVVVGSYAVGMTMKTSRAPAPGETVEGREFSALHGGKGSNQAVACARLGSVSTFLACVGTDSSGDAAMRLYAEEHVDTRLMIRHPSLPTGVGFIVVEDSGENLIVVDFGANRALSPDDVRRAAPSLRGAKVVMSQLEIEPETAAEAMISGRQMGTLTVLNPAPYRGFPNEAWSYVDIVTPNLTEARQIAFGTQDASGPAEPAAIAERINRLGVRSVVITLGARGAYISSEDVTGEVAGFKVTAVDTTGAGDVFAAALAVGIADGRSMPDSVEFAVAAAALCTTRYGVIPAIPYRHEVETLMSSGMRA